MHATKNIQTQQYNLEVFEPDKHMEQNVGRSLSLWLILNHLFEAEHMLTRISLFSYSFMEVETSKLEHLKVIEYLTYFF